MYNFIEFNYTNDRYTPNSIQTKHTKYQSFLQDISQRGWNVAPLLVLIASAYNTTHTSILTNLHEPYKINKDTLLQPLHKLTPLPLTILPSSFSIKDNSKIINHY